MSCPSKVARVAERAHLPHQVVVLEQVHVFGGQESPGEGAHLCSGFDPGLGEDPQAFSRDGALGDDHLAGKHQAGELLHLCECKKKEKGPNK